MDITYLGHSSFRLRGKNATVVTDPYNSDIVGLKFPKHIEADIVTVSHEHKDHSTLLSIEGNPYIINGPGEYEVKGVGVVGHATNQNTIYRIEIDGVAIVHLGRLDRTLTTAEVDELDGVHILMIPIDVTQAVAVINEIEPSIVIPMQYEKSQLDAFLKEIGKEVVPQAKLTISKDKMPEVMQVVVLE